MRKASSAIITASGADHHHVNPLPNLTNKASVILDGGVMHGHRTSVGGDVREGGPRNHEGDGGENIRQATAVTGAEEIVEMRLGRQDGVWRIGDIMTDRDYVREVRIGAATCRTEAGREREETIKGRVGKERDLLREHRRQSGSEV